MKKEIVPTLAIGEYTLHGKAGDHAAFSLKIKIEEGGIIYSDD